MNIPIFDLLYYLQRISKETLKFANICNEDLTLFTEWLKIHELALNTIEQYFRCYDYENYVLINCSVPFCFEIGDHKNSTLDLFKDNNKLLFRSARTNLILFLIRKIIYQKHMELINNLKRIKAFCYLEIFIIEKEESQNV